MLDSSAWGKPPDSGAEQPLRLYSSATPAGTGDASGFAEPRPILWRVQVALNRRNARKAVGLKGLKVRANPAGNRSFAE